VTRKLLLSMFACGMLGLLAVPAFGQSCALCYTQAASAGRSMIAALRSGILVLIIPPTLGTIGMIFVVHRRRNQIRRLEESEDTDLASSFSPQSHRDAEET
jgi:hypothetical protein